MSIQFLLIGHSQKGNYFRIKLLSHKFYKTVFWRMRNMDKFRYLGNNLQFIKLNLHLLKPLNYWLY